MKKLAIIGHSTREKEVIKILEMLGGKNKEAYSGKNPLLAYYIDDRGEIDYINNCNPNEDILRYTFEEFLEKYPYKVGDKVLARGSSGKITDMKWQGDSFFTTKEEGEVIYTVMLDTEEEITFLVEDLQPSHKEQETVKDNSTLNQLSELDSKTFADGYDQGYDDGQHDMTEWDLPDGFIFKDENGNVINANKIVLEKKKPQYPKTYEECHELMVQWTGCDCNPNPELILSDVPIHDFCKLIIARNIYWKIAGEQMGLDKPWEPDFKDDSDKYLICYLKDEIWKSNIRDCNRLLVFPTEKIRDEFYENFKDLIKICKNLI